MLRSDQSKLTEHLNHNGLGLIDKDHLYSLLSRSHVKLLVFGDQAHIRMRDNELLDHLVMDALAWVLAAWYLGSVPDSEANSLGKVSTRETGRPRRAESCSAYSEQGFLCAISWARYLGRVPLLSDSQGEVERRVRAISFRALVSQRATS